MKTTFSGKISDAYYSSKKPQVKTDSKLIENFFTRFIILIGKGILGLLSLLLWLLAIGFIVFILKGIIGFLSYYSRFS